MAVCWSCAQDLGEAREVPREETCPKCATWVHCCKNCRFWDDGARACDEPAAEWVPDRERANFCDFFAIAPTEDGAARSEGRSSGRSASSGPAGSKGKDSGREAFERLFRK